MGIKDTNLATAFEGLLQPVEDDDTPGGTFRPELPTPQIKRDNGSLPEAKAFLPLARPLFPVLKVLDDSQRNAETIRIRSSPFRIGRVEGDLTIPLDSQLSSCHAELHVKHVSGQTTWYLKDLGSMNGTFVRVSRVLLRANQTVLIGSQRFRYEESSSQSDAGGVPESERTQQWAGRGAPSVAAGVPQLVHLDSEEARPMPLTLKELWLGRDPSQCNVVVEDSMVSPRHVRLFEDRKGRWNAEECNSLNGLWAQVDEVALDRAAWFQCGEQRFLFKPRS